MSSSPHLMFSMTLVAALTESTVPATSSVTKQARLRTNMVDCWGVSHRAKKAFRDRSPEVLQP